MVVLAKGELEQIALPAAQPAAADVRSVDLSAAAGPARSAAARALVAACEDHGFFRVTGHGVPAELVRAAEAAASGFFARPQGEKEEEAPKACPICAGRRLPCVLGSASRRPCR